jgi:hypothetical protein
LLPVVVVVEQTVQVVAAQAAIVLTIQVQQQVVYLLQ